MIVGQARFLRFFISGRKLVLGQDYAEQQQHFRSESLVFFNFRASKSGDGKFSLGLFCIRKRSSETETDTVAYLKQKLKPKTCVFTGHLKK